MLEHDASPTLLIASGIHAGASCVLPFRPFTIGADPAADVILHDDGVAPIHLVLEPEGVGELRMVVRAPGVTVEGSVLAEGETVICGLPAAVRLGPVELQCITASPAHTLPTAGHDLEVAGQDGRPLVVRSAAALLPRTTLGRAAGAGALAVVLAAIIGARVFMGNVAPARAASRLHVDIGREAIPSGIGDVRALTNAEIRKLGLQGVALAMQDGIVTVSGHIDPANGPKLQALELWFDHRFGENAVLLSQVSLAPAAQLAIALQAVWSGPDPNIVVAGQRYGIGAALPDGTVVGAITDHAVQLLSNGQPYSVEY